MPADFINDGDLARDVRELKRQMRMLLSGRGLGASAVEGELNVLGGNSIKVEGGDVEARQGGSFIARDGGGINILDSGQININGGQLRLLSNGASVVYFGPVALDGGESGAGFIFAYDDGSPVFFMGGEPGQQVFSFRDQSGHEVLSSDSLSGAGLARPHLNYRLVPSQEAQTFGTSFVPSHTSTSFVTLWEGVNPVFHPRVTLGILPNATGGGTAHWRLLVDGTDVSGDRTGTAVDTFDIPGWGDEGGINPGDGVGFEVQGYIDGGSNVLLQVDRCHANQS